MAIRTTVFALGDASIVGTNVLYTAPAGFRALVKWATVHERTGGGSDVFELSVEDPTGRTGTILFRQPIAGFELVGGAVQFAVPAEWKVVLYQTTSLSRYYLSGSLLAETE